MKNQSQNAVTIPNQFSRVKVFSASSRRKDELGEEITQWLRETGSEVVECHVRQSSDSEYHCLSFVLFLK